MKKIPWQKKLIPSHPWDQTFIPSHPIPWDNSFFKSVPWDGMGWDCPIPLGALAATVLNQKSWYQIIRFIQSQGVSLVNTRILSNSEYGNKSCGSTMAIFSHFTYHNSGGTMLICNLQRVKTNNGYILTDPVICSVQGVFGVTDIGDNGIPSFFASHDCTESCKTTWRKHGSPKPFQKVIMGTTFLL